MARADLLCELIKAGLRKDDMTFRRATQAICAEERTKQHEILANKIEQLLKENPEQTTYTSRNPSMHTIIVLIVFQSICLKKKCQKKD